MALNEQREMNHCLLEAEVVQAPKTRYTQDNKTPIAEMEVRFAGLRADDTPGQIKVIGWGNLAQEIQNSLEVGQKLVLEGRLRMNTLPRQDGTKEKRAELTLSRFHPLSNDSDSQRVKQDLPPTNKPIPTDRAPEENAPVKENISSDSESVSWNTSPLIPDTDEIPF